jgi:inorganic pyrophosphatase
MFMRIDAIPIGRDPPHDVNVIVEVPLGGQPIKYELDKEAGTLVVERFLYTSMAYPGNYGFVPHTLASDARPIRVLVCNTRPLVAGCVINVRPIGVLAMEDDTGRDDQVIAVPSPHLTRRYAGVTNYSDVPIITLQHIEHFFEHYRDLEDGKWVKIGDWGDAAEARRMIAESISRGRPQTGRA